MNLSAPYLFNYSRYMRLNTTLWTYGYLEFQNCCINCVIQTFVWSIICLFTLLVIRKITPIPIVMETNIWKCFLSVPVIHDPPNLPHVSFSYPIHTSLLSEDYPRISRPPNNQASPRTFRDRRIMYSTTGQYDHTLSKKQYYQVTHSL